MSSWPNGARTEKRVGPEALREALAGTVGLMEPGRGSARGLGASSSSLSSSIALAQESPRVASSVEPSVRGRLARAASWSSARVATASFGQREVYFGVRDGMAKSVSEVCVVSV